MTVSNKIKIKRHPERGVYDRDTICRILDEAFVCHVGFVYDNYPVVIPTIYGRSGDTIFIHGSSASRMIIAAGEGVPVCVEVSIIDGLVLARSAFDHSMNYRSVVVFGTAQPVLSEDKKTDALRVISDHILPGRWEEVRKPTKKELKATTVLSIPLNEASAKIRTGPPKDQEEDYLLKVWAGELPIKMIAGEPKPDPKLHEGIHQPGYLKKILYVDRERV